MIKNLNIELCSSIETTQQFEVNFIQSGINEELDNNTNLLTESFAKLESIRDYFNSLIGKTEKAKAKTTDFVKLHETEKNSFSLVATKRRCTILKESMKKMDVNNIIELQFKENTQKFELKFSKEEIIFTNQSASNDSITSSQINMLCKNITNIKLKMKDMITSVYGGILSMLEQYQTEIDAIIRFIINF